MANNTATVLSVDEDFIKIGFGSEFADMILHQLLRYNAQIILEAMDQTVTTIYENSNSVGLWEDLQQDMKRIEAINVLLEYHGHPLIDISAEMERASKHV